MHMDAVKRKPRGPSTRTVYTGGIIRSFVVGVPSECCLCTRSYSVKALHDHEIRREATYKEKKTHTEIQ